MKLKPHFCSYCGSKLMFNSYIIGKGICKKCNKKRQKEVETNYGKFIERRNRRNRKRK